MKPGCIALSLILISSVEAAPLQESEVVSSLFVHHPQSKSATANVENFEGLLLSKKGVFDPKLKAEWSRAPLGTYLNSRIEAGIEQRTSLYGLSFFGSYALADGPFPVYDSKFLTGNDGEVSLGVKLPLLRGGLTDPDRADLSVAEYAVDQAQADRQVELTELKKKAKQKYWDWVLSGTKVKTYEAYVKLAEDRDRALEVRSKAGDIAQLERRDHLRLVISRKNRLNIENQAWIEKTQALSLFLRSESGAPAVPAPDRLPDIFSFSEHLSVDLNQPKEQLTSLVERHPKVYSIQAKIAQTEQKLELTQNEILPQLDLKVERTRELGQSNSIYNQPDELRATLQFQINLPLRRERGLRNATENQLADLRFQRQFVYEQISASLLTTVDQLKILEQSLELARDEAKTAREVAKGEQRRFLAGQSNVITVNLREESAIEAELRWAELISQYRSKQAELEAIAEPVR